VWPKKHIAPNGVKRRQKTPNQPHSRHEPRRFRPKVNITFTDYSRLQAMMLAIRKGHPKPGQGLGTMRFINHIVGYAAAIREFVSPTYRPERYYMRGPGPACARRSHSFGISAH
jgi:hypothetical protein